MTSVESYPAEFQRAEPLLRSRPDYYATPGIKKKKKKCLKMQIAPQLLQWNGKAAAENIMFAAH